MIKKETFKQPAYLLAGVLFTLIALVALTVLLVIRSKADTATQEAEIGAAAPTVDSITVSDTPLVGDIGMPGGSGFTTNEGATKSLYVRGQVTDPNGCTDLTSVRVTVYRSGAARGSLCIPDKNDCYTVTLLPENFDAGCTAGVNTVTFETSFSLASFVDPTDAGSPYSTENWVVGGEASDHLDSGVTLSSDFEVNSLAALDVDEAIAYGPVGLGQVSNPVTLEFRNSGNREIDTDVVAVVDPQHLPEPLVGDMTSNLSGFANIPASATHYSMTSDFTYGAGDMAVSKTASTELDLNLPQQTDDLVQTSVDSFWRLRMPDSGVNGTYTNTLMFTALTPGYIDPSVSFDERSMVDFSTTVGSRVSVVSGNYAFIASNYGNFSTSVVSVVDYTDIENPSLVATVYSTIQPEDMEVSGNYLYLVANETNDFQVIDITNPASPSIVAAINACDYSQNEGSSSIEISGNYAYITCRDLTYNFKVIDISDPEYPEVMSGIAFPGQVGGVQVHGNYAYVYSSVGNKDGSVNTIKAIDITDPAEPWTSLSYSVDVVYVDNVNFKLSDDGNYAYLLEYQQDEEAPPVNRLQIVNVSNPETMAVIKTLTVNNKYGLYMSVSGDYVYVSDWSDIPGPTNLTAIDVSTPANASVVGTTQVGVSGAGLRLFANGLNVFANDEDGWKFYAVTVIPPLGAPVINSLDPSFKFINSGDFTLLLEGENFQSSDTIKWNGSPRETIWISSTQMEALIGASDLVTAGTAVVKVTTEGRVDSNTMNFTINPLN